MSAIVCPTSRCFYILRTEPLIFLTNRRPASLGEIFKLPRGGEGGLTFPLKMALIAIRAMR